MDFHGINTVGEIKLERINSKPIFQYPKWIGRIIFALDTQTLSIGTSAGWIDIVSALYGGITHPSVPIDGIILFESDVAMAGYQLLTDLDDVSVMITKGSGAGGAAGGGDQGDWDLSHTHNQGSLSVPDHKHQWYNFVSPNASFSWDSDGSTQINMNIGTFPKNNGLTGHISKGDGHIITQDFWTQNTSVSISGNTGSAAITSWRPKARNFTRQKKI